MEIIVFFLKRTQPLPWLCLGDFNKIVDNSKKVWGIPRTKQQMGGLREVIQECNLGDLGFKGLKYTWSNKRERGMFVKERLDRGLASPEWCALFRNAGIEVEAISCSDHHPLWLRLDQFFRLAKKIFRYEASWNVIDDWQK